MQRQQVTAFFRFMNERQRIYIAKEIEGRPAPWTDDIVLSKYRFTNVFRRFDRVTRYYMDHVYTPNYERPNHELLFNTILFRAFNWPPTWEQIGWRRLWGPRLTSKYAHKLAQFKAQGNKLFTGAYITASLGFKGPKALAYLQAMEPIWQDSRTLAKEIARTQSMEYTVDRLKTYRGLGPFTSYEVACDLQYTKLLINAHDVDTWANPGPGADRGINRIYGRPLTYRVPRDEAIVDMRDLLARSRKRGGWAFWDRFPLHMREIEHSLCEFDKYQRGSTRSTYSPETRY